MVLRVEIDRDECMSAGRCVTAAPLAFALDADGLAVTRPGGADLDEARLRRIVEDCPSQALSLVTDR